MTPHAAERTRELSKKELRALARTWESPKGFYGWLVRADHKAVGVRFIITAFIFFLLGGILALVMRLQLAQPGGRIVSSDLYSQLFSTHGSTMMFLFAVPVMQALAVYLVPLMVGAREIAFPRLNAFGYWIYLFGGIMLYVALAVNSAPEAGWFSYVPLADLRYSAGKRSDIYAQLITFTELSSLAVSVQVVTTIFKLRAPGMSLNRMPVFAWASLVTAFMIMFAMPAIMLGSSFLIADRLIYTQFFNPAKGGDVLLWQHLFWFFGHPEVYIIFVPALGIISSIVPAFARRRLFGYPAVVASMILTGILGFGLWVHHMFATHLSQLGQAYFTAMSMMITIPTGIQIFCWLATLWDGKPIIRTPLLFVIGFFINFVIGGLTGVMVASVPLDLQVHDTYFVVAHLHYVLIGGAVFPLFGGFYYWFPKITGRMLSERMGRWNFVLLMLGTNATFFPMHELGLVGMPRRVYTYPAGMNWADLNLLASIGAATLALGVLLFI
ncbi:MAG TPA: cbb3-type cytochrome c oxidase subunit I, partial [Xanthobacteraceae bacterium]|nr:cbb3-type cytochrome c oxidase subunit I [Xanthobacteraceae bacterium]